MFTRFFLALKNLPSWLRDVKNHDLLLFYGFWALVISFLISILHFFSFRNDIVYLILMVVFPLIVVLIQTGKNIHSRNKDSEESPYQFTAQNLPVLFILVMMLTNFPMIVFSHNGFGSAIYDEYFVLFIFTFVLLMFYFILTRLRGKIRLGILSIVYLIGLFFIGITYILAITV